MTVGELLGLLVRTESGERLGRVHDVRGELTPRTVRITGLVVGRAGLLERLGVGNPSSDSRVRGKDHVPWAAVVRANRRGVVVRDGTSVR
jgi:sporulation protein YlmC with PRC-barrel domain